MTKWKVIIYGAFGAYVASDGDYKFDGNHLVFDTRQEAERYGESKRCVFEPVEVKEEQHEQEDIASRPEQDSFRTVVRSKRL